MFSKNSNFWMYAITGTTFVMFASLSIVTLLLVLDRIPAEYLRMSPNVALSTKPFATVIMISSAFQALFSILSAIGIKKEQPLLIAFYVGYGTFMVIHIFITALLLLIWMYWGEAMGVLFLDVLYIFCLVKMHDGYESIMRGKCSGNLEHNLLQEEEVPA